MTSLRHSPVARTDLDGVAVKPLEHDLSQVAALDAPLVNIDYEGREAFPDEETLTALADGARVAATTPVRADGFDPLGDDSMLPLPDGIERVLVAGNPAYLADTERERAVAPRLGAARETAPDAWVGTEGVERLAMAAGGPQYELLSRNTGREARALRAAGFAGDLALYAPVALSDDEDEILDAVGGYAARRGPVKRALPDDAVTDGSADGRAREVLSQAVRDYALVGGVETVAEQVADLRDAGIDTVVGYPARGLDDFLG